MNTKELILKELELNKGCFISGAMLAEKCNVSRNAIWKGVTELKKAGYPIESVNNKGYMLSESSDIISVQAVEGYLSELLKDKTSKKRICNIYVYEELSSTNTEAKRMLLTEDSLLHGTVIIAKTQTAGKGHGGRSFLSPEGGIYLSIILEPSKMKRRDIKVTELVAKTVSEVLDRSLGIETEIRKNSSIYYKGHKICGILTEGISDLETGVFSNYIIGIGIRYQDLSDTDAKVTKNGLIAEIVSGII